MFGRLVSAALPHRTALFVALFVAGPVNTRGKILTSPLSLSLFPSLLPFSLSLSLSLSRRFISAHCLRAHLAAFNTSARFSSLAGLPFRCFKPGERNGQVIVAVTSHVPFLPSAFPFFPLTICHYDKYSFSKRISFVPKDIYRYLWIDQFLHYIYLFFV